MDLCSRGVNDYGYFFFLFLFDIKRRQKDSSLLEEVKSSEQDYVAQMQQPHVPQ